MARRTVNDNSLTAQLAPAILTMATVTATLVVMHHNPLTDPDLVAIHRAADLGYHTAGLMTGDHRAAVTTKAEGCRTPTTR